MQLVFTVFLPAIIFVNLGEAISLDKLIQWYASFGHNKYPGNKPSWDYCTGHLSHNYSIRPSVKHFRSEVAVPSRQCFVRRPVIGKHLYHQSQSRIIGTFPASYCSRRWFIPVNVIIASVTGCLLGMLVAWVTDCPPEFFRIVYVLTGIGE